MSNTISVEGKSNVTVKPDMTVVTARITGNRKTFEEAVRRMGEVTSKLKDAIEAAGIPRDDLRTSEVNVRQAWRKECIGEDRRGNDKFKDVPDGFDFSQNIRFEFKNDNSKLSKAVTNIIACDVTPRIDFGFRCSDPAGARNRALEEAARNAKNEAEIIVGSVGYRLGKLVSVHRESKPLYGYDDDSDDYLCCNKELGSAPVEIDVNPADTVFSEKVSMTWEIE